MLNIDIHSTATYVCDAFGRPDALTDASDLPPSSARPVIRRILRSQADLSAYSSARMKMGRRIEKTTSSGSLVHLYDPAGHQVAEMDTSGNNVRDDIWAGSRQLAMYYSNSTYFFNADQVGTERVATDPTGAVAQTCINMPYGDDFSCTGSLPTGFFAGYDFDSETGLYHSPARYYSPALGRFMTPDPLSTAVPENPAGDTWTAQDVGLQAMGLLETRYTPLDEATHSEPGQAAPDLGPGYGNAGPLPRLAGRIIRDATQLSPQGWNAYAYVTGSPCALTDITGADTCGSMMSYGEDAMAIGAIAAGVGAVTSETGVGAAVGAAGAVTAGIGGFAYLLGKYVCPLRL